MSITQCRTLAILITVFALALPQPAHADQNPPPPRADQKLVEANTQFALDLYAQLSKDAANDNIFFSPLSLSTALAQTYAGARGNTAKEMKDALHFDLDPVQLHPAMGALLKDLESPKDKAAYQLNIANALWVEQTYRLLPEYVTLCKDQYRAEARAVDFKTAAEAQRKTINDWAEERTQGKIKDLLAPSALEPDTRLVLTNAIYFRCDWKQKFDRADTHDGTFKLADGKSVEVPMMQQEGEFSSFRDKDIQALEMPYAASRLSMIIILPRKVDGLADLEKNLNAVTLGSWIARLYIGRLEQDDVFVRLPRFTMTISYQLNPKLQAMGMRDAFSAKADFSGMSGKSDLFISEVIQKAFVDVNEEGTKAAAAGAVGEPVKSAPLDFIADHPFLFLIRDLDSGTILFLGRVMNPKA
jgi:serpin B